MVLRVAPQKARPVFDVVLRLWARVSDSLWSGLSLWTQSLTIRGRVFDDEWYLEHNPDAADYNGTLADHFLRYGMYEGRKARFFDSKWYFTAHRDLWTTRLDAWTHYKRFGEAEGRTVRFFYVTSSIERPGTRNFEEWADIYDAPNPLQVGHMRNMISQLGLKTRFAIGLNIQTRDPRASDAPDAIRALRSQIYEQFTCRVGITAGASGLRQSVVAAIAGDARFELCDLPADTPQGKAFNTLLKGMAADYRVALGPQDLLSDSALLWAAHAIYEHPEADLFYADEDHVPEVGTRLDPALKPQFNYELFLSHNLLGDFTVWRCAAFDALDGFDAQLEHDAVYDLGLRFVEQKGTQGIVHIPRVLNHRRDERNARPVDTGLIKAHLKRLGKTAQVLPVSEVLGHNRVRFDLPKPAPMVSILIPTRDRAELMALCLESLFAKTTYSTFEVIIIDNGSVEAATHALFARYEDNPRVRILRDDRPFNFSGLNNAAAAIARGEYLCLMNNDIEIITPDWLEEMLSFAVQPEVGCVGARLWYPDDTLQHGGVLVGFHGVAGHMHKLIPRSETGFNHRAALHQSLSAVTAAVLVVRRSLYEAMGGFDETLAVAFNDVDFCLKVRDAGYRNVYTPYAEMYHHESASRGAEDSPAKRAREQTEMNIIKTRYGESLMRDPAFNPNLSLTSEAFAFAFPPRVKTPREILLDSNIDTELRALLEAEEDRAKGGLKHRIKTLIKRFLVGRKAT